MLDRRVKFKDTDFIAVSDLTMTELNIVLRDLDKIEYLGTTTPENLKERVLIEICARDMDI